MNDDLRSKRLESAYQTALAALLAERTPDGHWVGELSASALSTATAISALALVQKHTGRNAQPLIDGGLAWLAAHQNADGGWGDTVKSFSNISTSMLCRAAFHLTGGNERYRASLERVETWLAERYGRTPEQLSEAVRQRYGKDRTFSVPILTTCALAGLVSWKEVPALPFELACFPQSWFRFLRLQVVSYALPALIAIGQCVYYHKKPWNPLALGVRYLARRRSLRVLRAIQPASGGYLEATPLTSFVTLSLASIGQADHPVARAGARFLANSVLPDGSWAIDSDLATWVTTLALHALEVAAELEHLGQTAEVYDWLVRQQYTEPHPYTGAAPGGWAWTPLPGGVPDADDTPGAMLALLRLGETETCKAAVPSAKRWHGCEQACQWIRGLQNHDGGWPTFCRGWGSLPFDRSGTDLTAHNLRALAALGEENGMFHHEKTSHPHGDPIRRGLAFLARSQRPDGSWLPLWFGNQHTSGDENPTYGTARVLAAYRDLSMMTSEPAQRGIAWLIGSQNPDGGWGGARDTPSSLEETALAVEVLLDAPGANDPGTAVEYAVNKGLAWLVEKVESGGLNEPTPMGFYFAKLWYFEKLYPMVFAVAALGRARRKLSVTPDRREHSGK